MVALQELWEGGGGTPACFAMDELGVETTDAEEGDLFNNQTVACHPSPYPKVCQPYASADQEPEEGLSWVLSPPAPGIKATARPF